MTPLRLYWARCGARYGNFGDEASRLIVEQVSKRPVEWAPAEEAELVAVGSIADHLPVRYAGAVWGTGVIQSDQAIVTPRARLCAVRGPLTATRWLGAQALPLGDPLLLLEPTGVAKRYRLGIVPHYVDFDNAGLYEFAQRESGVTVIDVCARANEVLDRIESCELLLSSSLHGLVVADALGIPNLWTVFSTKIVGGHFKFEDYYAAVGVLHQMPYGFDASPIREELEARIRTSWQPRTLESLRRDLLASFPADLRAG